MPDAIKWHCAYYWDHALPKQQINRVKKTNDLLKASIAIPISLKKNIKQYQDLANKILKINKKND